MSILSCLLLAVLAAAPDVAVSTVQGKTEKGAFQELSAEALTVKTAAGKEVKVPLAELLHVNFAKPTPLKIDPKTSFTVTLTDGTELACTKFSTTASEAKLQSPLFGALRLPVNSVASVRLMPMTATLQDRWNELLKREIRKDLLIVPRPKPPAAAKTLDFVQVVVARVADEEVTFAFGGMEQKLPRSRFFGIIFSRAKKDGEKPVCTVKLAGGGPLKVSRVRWDGTTMTARLLAGVNVEIPAANVAVLDFSLGKVQYLADTEPRDEEFTPYFDDDLKLSRSLFRYRKNKTDLNKKLQLGKTVYDRGLWIHSKTMLKYRIGGDYRRFRAVMGIDQDAAKDGIGNVSVEITGDGKKLFEGTVRWSDAPRNLDLDVTNVRELKIVVDYGDNDATGDHLDLCDARVIK
jgi:NPCBM/NEW2 domain